MYVFKSCSQLHVTQATQASWIITYHFFFLPLVFSRSIERLKYVKKLNFDLSSRRRLPLHISHIADNTHVSADYCNIFFDGQRPLSHCAVTIIWSREATESLIWRLHTHTCCIIIINSQTPACSWVTVLYYGHKGTIWRWGLRWNVIRIWIWFLEQWLVTENLNFITYS